MMRISFQLIAPWIALLGLLHGQSIPTVPSELVLPPSLAASGTGAVVNGSAWGYVVWQATDPTWYGKNDIAVYLKSGDANSAAPFALQGTMAPLNEPASIQTWIGRAQKLITATGGLAEDLDVCQMNAGNLITQWSATPNPTIPPALKDRLAILGNRAIQEPGAAAALRAMGGNHPLFRFVTGTGWAGALGVPIGQDATIELRNIVRATGVEGTVVARVTLRAVNMARTTISPDIVLAPGQAVQVVPDWPTQLPPVETAFAIPPQTDLPDLAPALRWSIPEAMRRQILLTRGFMVWRADVAGNYGSAGSLLDANLKKVLRNPAAADKIFKGTDGVGTGPQVNDFAADRKTFFVADDNGRYDFTTKPPDGQLPVITGVAHEPDFDKFYHVAAADLLGRYGPPAPAGRGVPVKTLPPVVPQILRVENIVSNGNQRLRVTFRQNANGPADVFTVRYLIFRDRLKNTAAPDGALDRSINPTRNNEMIYVGEVDHEEDGKELSFVDESLAPVFPADYGQTYYYCVRAVNLRERGLPGMNISPPSPPVFGTVRDRVGPPAASGTIVSERPRAGMTFVSLTNLADPKVSSGMTRIRMQFNRLDPGISSVRVSITSKLPGEPDASPAQKRTLPILYFGNGNEISFDYIVNTRNRGSGPVGFEYVPVTSGGRLGLPFSFSTPLNDLPDAATQTQSYDLKSGLLMEMTPDDPAPAFWFFYFVKFDGTPVGQTFTFTTGLDQVSTATFPRGASAVKDRSLLIQRRSTISGGAWQNISTAILPRNSAQFSFVNDQFSAFFQYRVWEVFDRTDEVEPDLAYHSTDTGNSLAKSPLRVNLNLPIGTFEYRLYRRIDNGPLFLLKQDTGTWDPLLVKATVFNDGLLPGAGGEISYFAQTFDQHGNAGPMALIGKKVYVLPELPVPVVDAMESGGTTAQPTVFVRATCPSPGVERMEIIMDPPPLATPGIVSVAKSPGLMLNPKPGGVPSGPQIYNGSLLPDTLFVNDPNIPAVLDKEVRIEAGKEYTITVRALGKGGNEGVASPQSKFTWTAPLVGSAVPWPARPLAAPLIWAQQVEAFIPLPENYVVIDQTPATGRQILDPTVKSRPVAIQIGTIPLANKLRQGVEPTSNWDVFEVRSGGATNFLVSGTFGMRDLPGYAASNGPDDLLNQFVARKEISIGDIATISTTENLFPVVLYRQQTHRKIETVLSAVVDADIVQVSPMIQKIAWAPTGSSNYALFIDPYVGVVRRNTLTDNNPSLALCLYDTAPVATGARYRYFLAHFDEAFEIDGVIDAGVVEIPETP